jgi:hypothetical protein
VLQNSPACAAGAANETKASVHSAAADAVITFEIISVAPVEPGRFLRIAALVPELGMPIHFDNSE